MQKRVVRDQRKGFPTAANDACSEGRSRCWLRLQQCHREGVLDTAAAYINSGDWRCCVVVFPPRRPLDTCAQGLPLELPPARPMRQEWWHDRGQEMYRKAGATHTGGEGVKNYAEEAKALKRAVGFSCRSRWITTTPPAWLEFEPNAVTFMPRWCMASEWQSLLSLMSLKLSS